ncbi:GDSL esterase/lipase 5-like [Senna tora]|uniref:GDSL esterase/lipase 5-like n=1 Tax=Senna tora TaxID=362788 RepID=A0A834W9A5_9FABA|nr:GDSL esterase/lipase 5-like [Senna tora]
MYGVNFASAGAGALVHTYQGTVIDLKAQACNFKQVVKRLRKKLGDEEAEALLARAVYIISVGGNDYSAPLLTNSRASNNSTLILPYPPQQFVHLVIANISTFIQEIYEEGGRKFGILNVGPLNCFPMLRTPKSSIDACQQEQISTLALLHRNALPKMLQNLHNQLKAFQHWHYGFC